MTNTKTIKLYLYGMVQGVGIRFTITQIAKKTVVKGYVKNLSNGSVEIVAQGHKDKIDTFIEKVKNASTGNITDIFLETIDTKKTFNGFNIAF